MALGWRRLGEVGGFWAAWMRDSDPDGKLSFKDGKPGGGHRTDASIWIDLGGACTLHAAI